MTRLIFISILFIATTSYTQANILDRLLNVTSKTFMENCDSEYVKEYKNYDYKNVPKTYADRNYWFKEIEKAEKRKKYCRKAQALFHLYNFLPWQEYHDLEIHKQVIESLYRGQYFLELQWQIKNYREFYGENVDVEMMQVKSYWTYIDEINESQKCIAPTGYYTDPKTRKDHDLVTESFLSANDFLKKFGDSKYASEVANKMGDIKNARVQGLLCRTRSSLKSLERRKEHEINAYHYFALYKRLSDIVVNFKEQKGVDEALYILIDITHKLYLKTQDGPPQDGSFDEHPEEFIFQEDWLSKEKTLRNILKDNYPHSHSGLTHLNLFNF